MPRVYWNGEPLELPVEGELIDLGDRFGVRTADGLKTGTIFDDGDNVHVSYDGQVFVFSKAANRQSTSAASSGELRAPMPGQVVDVPAAEGDAVAAGAKIVILEAMKTQQPLVAPFAGTVIKIACAKGDQVEQGAVLAVVAKAEEDQPSSHE